MIVSYFKYLQKAKGDFRLHSPLVFDLYNKVLKQLPKKGRTEELDRRLKAFVNDNPLVFNDDDCIMVVDGIHEYKKNEDDWNRLCEDGNVSLSIDCWSFGLVFVMRRLKKEHFVLRV
ncbi:MAG: hypothetical protein KBT67_04450 [bacterium]|nr:hypothetical protein [Candidatus Limimorpha caballi]